MITDPFVKKFHHKAPVGWVKMEQWLDLMYCGEHEPEVMGMAVFWPRSILGGWGACVLSSVKATAISQVPPVRWVMLSCQGVESVSLPLKSGLALGLLRPTQSNRSDVLSWKSLKKICSSMSFLLEASCPLCPFILRPPLAKWNRPAGSHAQPAWELLPAFKL